MESSGASIVHSYVLVSHVFALYKYLAIAKSYAIGNTNSDFGVSVTVKVEYSETVLVA